MAQGSFFSFAVIHDSFLFVVYTYLCEPVYSAGFGTGKVSNFFSSSIRLFAYTPNFVKYST